MTQWNVSEEAAALFRDNAGSMIVAAQLTVFFLQPDVSECTKVALFYVAETNVKD